MLHWRSPQVHNTYFACIEKALLTQGIAPHHVRRTMMELKDHHDDLVAEARSSGANRAQAVAMAKRRLGKPSRLAKEVLTHRELMTPTARWPLLSRTMASALSLLAIPIMPIAYCASHGETIAKWGLSIGLSAIFTATLLLGMQLAIIAG